MNFETQFGVNQEHYTQRIRDLATEGEPEFKLPLCLAKYDLEYHLAI